MKIFALYCQPCVLRNFLEGELLWGKIALLLPERNRCKEKALLPPAIQIIRTDIGRERLVIIFLLWECTGISQYN